MENVQQQPDHIVQKPSDRGLALRGIVQVLYAPAELFKKIKDTPKLLIAWLVFFVLILSFFLIAGDVITNAQLDIMKEKAVKGGQVLPQQMPTFEQMKWSTIIFGSVFIMLSPLIAGLLGLFFGNVVMAGRASFKQILSVMVYGEIIYALGALIVAPMMVAKNSVKVGFSLATFFKDLSIQSPLYLLLSKVGVFYIWEIIVIGIGLSIIYEFPRNKGYLLAVLSMGMISILHVLTGLLFG